MTRAGWLWPVLIILSALAISIMTFGDSQFVLRPVVALWFLVICPGKALVGVLRISEKLTELTLAVALSLVIDAVVSEALIYVGLWSPKSSLAVIVAITMSGLALQGGQAFWRRQRSPSEATGVAVQ
jgi:uncharacterized membrane protein